MTRKNAVLGIAVLAFFFLAILFLNSRNPKFAWPDRRPIASLTLATAAAGWPGNPRGWFLDPKLDPHLDPARFQQRLLAWADGSVAIMRAMDAQGMITWDLEGEEFPHKTTYIGDPRLLDRLAPEMAVAADLYFQRFTQAGFRVGLAIRPQQLQFPAEGGAPTQTDVEDPASLLIEKIRYAKARWGATLFYVDSNHRNRIPLRAAVFERVLRAVPGILLIPEHSTPFYYPSTAPYSELRGLLSGTPAILRRLYPGAFGVIDTADGQMAQRREEVAEAVRNGDILMFRGWFNDRENAAIHDIYQQR